MEFICYNGTDYVLKLLASISQGYQMGPLNNIFSLVIGINLMLVGLVAFISGIVSLAKKDESVKKLTSIAYIIAGIAGIYFGVVLSRSSFNM
jgi:uncharacterized membrane protein YuzA (DUF378 family)